MGTEKVSPLSASPLPPNSTIGILGDGQLGRMLALAAARLGLRVHSYGTAPDGPAAQVSHRHTHAAFDDGNALERFASEIDAATYEWENVPVRAAQIVGTGRRLAPGVVALRTAQDRLLEKTFLQGLPGVEVAPFREVPSQGEGGTVHDLRRAVQYVGLPCVLKTRRGGYDGKGQVVLRKDAEVEDAWEAFGAHALVLEKHVGFTRELSVVAVRGHDGEVRCYPAAENDHRGGVLHTSTAPVPDFAEGAEGAEATVKAVVDALGYVGVIGVEFFDTGRGLLVNEFAPRVHNSGHWTQDAGCVDQFENHIRAVAGWPLGSTVPEHGVRMTNLLGSEVERWGEIAKGEGRLHLYGKREAREGRKMGHVNERWAAEPPNFRASENSG